jgi:hypothetical protein
MKSSELHRKMKITLWLDPAEYWQMMRMSTTLASGNLSMHKFIKAQLGLVKPKDAEAPTRSILSIVNKMVPYVSQEERAQRDQQAAQQAQGRSMAVSPRRQAMAARVAARKPRSPRRHLAA